MLADIGAEATDPAPVGPASAPASQRETVRLVVRAHGRAELFPQLERVLRERFGRVSSGHLEGDLLVPLRRAIGNADRRGNREDPGKWLTAELVMTSRGAVLEVADEGAGFDVERVVGQYERDERYFTRKGHGIACFAATRSLVSYANGGRTWLLRFLSDPEPGEPLSADESAALGPAGDAAFVRSFLEERVACFRDQGVTLDSCRVYALSLEPGTSELAYVLRCRSRDQEPEATVLTARLLPEAAARADVSMAAQLRDAGVGAEEGLRIPRPLGAFREPELALFQLDPSATLSEGAKKLMELGPLTRVLRDIATGLAAIHRSGVRPENAEGFEAAFERQGQAQPRVEARFSEARSRARVGACFERLLARSGSLAPCAPVPIHGALEWDCLVESGGTWQLYRFDRSRLGHPGLDVGAFLADLLRFHTLRSKGDPGLGEAGREAFLASYFDGPRPAWARDLDWFVAGALLERLDRLTRRKEAKWAPKVGPLLDEIERSLGLGGDLS